MKDLIMPAGLASNSVRVTASSSAGNVNEAKQDLEWKREKIILTPGINWNVW